MDIMDSTDTPTGGLDQTTASSYSSSALPLSVDQRDAFASPTNRSTYGGQQPTSSSDFSFSSGGSAFDRLDMANRIDADSPNALPTSTDDIMMPHVEYATHPSVLGGGSGSGHSDVAVSTSSHKAADAKAKAAEVAESAKAKAADAADSAKLKAAHLQHQAEDTAAVVKDKLEEGAEAVKAGSHRLLDMAKSGLHQAEDKLERLKEEHSQAGSGEPRTTTGGGATAPVVKSTLYQEKTEHALHPDASSTRDAHLIASMSSLATHGNEATPVKEPLMTDSHHRALMVGEAAHERALAAGEGATQRPGLLQRVHDRLEDGAEAVKEKVDGFLERNVRSDADHHLSAANTRDLPTLVDGSNEHNVEQVRAKMHPSQERGQ